MERTKTNKKVSAILCSDFHLREDTPTCWTGDFQKEQWDAVDFISALQKKYNCAIFHAGDLTHHWKASPWLLSMAIEHLPKDFYTCLGQHDLQNHSLDLYKKTGVYTLEQAKAVYVLSGTHWGQTPTKGDPDTNILVWHHLTYLSKPFPGVEGGMAEGILRKYPQFSLICTGDNHQSFTVEYQGRRLVNPGNITRQTADQMDFQPRIALWYAEDNSIEWVNLPIQEGVISRQHIQVKEERDARIDAFVSKLNGDYVAELSFEQNLETYLNLNNVREPIKEIIYRSLNI